MKIIPHMRRVRAHCERLANSVGIHQAHGNQVTIRNRRSLSNSQGVFVNRLDRTPGIDDLESTAEELLMFGWVFEVVADAVWACLVRLIDVDALNGPAQLGFGSRGSFWGCAADGVVEDVDLSGTSTVGKM